MPSSWVGFDVAAVFAAGGEVGLVIDEMDRASCQLVVASDSFDTSISSPVVARSLPSRTTLCDETKSFNRSSSPNLDASTAVGVLVGSATQSRKYTYPGPPTYRKKAPIALGGRACRVGANKLR